MARLFSIFLTSWNIFLHYLNAIRYSLIFFYNFFLRLIRRWWIGSKFVAVYFAPIRAYPLLHLFLFLFIFTVGGLALPIFGVDSLLTSPYCMAVLDCRSAYSFAALGFCLGCVLVISFPPFHSDGREVESSHDRLPELNWFFYRIVFLYFIAGLFSIWSIHLGRGTTFFEFSIAGASSASGILLAIAGCRWSAASKTLSTKYVPQDLGLHSSHRVILLALLVSLSVSMIFLLVGASHTILLGLALLLFAVLLLWELVPVRYRFFTAVALIFLTFLSSSFEWMPRGPYPRYTSVLSDVKRSPNEWRAETHPSFANTLAAWSQSSKNYPPIVIIAASGGAYRASFFTAFVLDHIADLSSNGNLPGFFSSVRLGVGASGGMVALAYLSALQDVKSSGYPLIPIGEQLMRDISKTKDLKINLSAIDSMSDVLSQTFTGDIFHLFSSTQHTINRGVKLERQWSTIDKMTFGDLALGEVEGWRTPLVFSPTNTKTGFPVLISNLRPPTAHATPFASFENGAATFRDALSSLRLSTAVRINAAFPLVSPAFELPPDPQSSLVDAGYFDNSGLRTAALFLLEKDTVDWISKNHREVIVVKINAFSDDFIVHSDGCFTNKDLPSEQNNRSLWDAKPLEKSGSKFFDFLRVPFQAYGMSRKANEKFAGDTLQFLLEAVYPGKIHVVEFVNGTLAPMSWHQTTKDLECMQKEVIRGRNARSWQELNRLWDSL